MDDLIRRSDALGCFHDWIDEHGYIHEADEMTEYQAIEALPSALPTPHGRLIDADALMANAEYKGKHDILTAYDVVAAPTIIPAEGGE